MAKADVDAPMAILRGHAAIVVTTVESHGEQ